MSRFALFILACALFASVTFTFASPAPVANGELVNLEKRITHVGRGTWYYPGMGNCGWENSAGDPVVAISVGLYDSNEASNCGQWMFIEYNGASTYARTVDSCQSCGPNDIDMSPDTFKALAPLSIGVIQVTWNFMNKEFSP